ncbi:MAG: hypothetical protein HY964_06375 [Ignavibacteriales bacterium]|nr:hypothetical protein [Ignavibacteriales bacterium]
MRKIFNLIILTLIIFSYSQSSDNKDILRFYPFADSVSEYPDMFKQLNLICSKKVDHLWVSFIGYKGENRVIIVAVTGEKIKNPNKDIYRTLDFIDGAPSLGKVTTWGYIFDRNKDGLADYMSLVDGAAPFLDDRVPESFPARGEKLNKLDLELYVNKCKIIFNHWADDNFDGRIDGFVHVDVDPLRDWVKRKIFARCTKFNDIFDNVWAFKKQITKTHEKVEYTGTKIPFRPFGKISDSFTKETLNYQSSVLSLINRGIKLCSVGSKLSDGK